MTVLRTRLVKRALASVGAGLVLLAATAREASARDVFPPVLAEKLGMPCVPSCLPCHTAVPGNINNLRGDGLALILFSAKPAPVADVDRLAAFLDAMLDPDGGVAPPGDADGDGTADLDELKVGDNPYGGGSLCGPKYGCGARVAPAAPPRLGGLALGLAAALGVGAVLLRRRRRT